MAIARSRTGLLQAARQGTLVAMVLSVPACSSDAGAGNGGSAGNSIGDFPDAQAYVDAHNAVRASVQKPTNYSSSWSPLPPVTWSDEVATSALEWANHLRDTRGCGLQHARSGYGENLAAGSNIDAERAVDLWASEIENYTYSPAFAFDDDTGHYTQIVWRKTREIGCASARCGGSSVVVCRYNPPGNYLGERPY